MEPTCSPHHPRFQNTIPTQSKWNMPKCHASGSFIYSRDGVVTHALDLPWISGFTPKQKDDHTTVHRRQLQIYNIRFRQCQFYTSKTPFSVLVTEFRFRQF